MIIFIVTPTQPNGTKMRLGIFILSSKTTQKMPKFGIVRHNWSLLGSSNKTTYLFNCRLVCGASHNPRLRDKLVNSSIPILPKYGQTGKISLNVCNTDNCKYCGYLDKSGQIRSHSFKQTFPVWHDIFTPLYSHPGVKISYDIFTPPYYIFTSPPNKGNIWQAYHFVIAGVFFHPMS